MNIHTASIQNYALRIYAYSLCRIYARSYAVLFKTPAGCGGLPNGTIPPTPESLELGIGGLGVGDWGLKIIGIEPKQQGTEQADREQQSNQTGN